MISTAVARRALHELLDRVRDGRITLVEDGVRASFGAEGHDHLAATITVHDPDFYRSALRGSIGLAGSYSDGAWDADDLATVFRIGARNMHRFDALRHALRPLTRMGRYLGPNGRRNDIPRAQKQIAAHYDVGNDFFSAMLDESLMYSAAIFESPGATLHDAQLAKIDRICLKLDLRPGDRVLELGTGWGGFALHAAGQYGAHVTTTTISGEQHALATERVAAAGIEDRVTVLLKDYRELQGTYDKLVAIEMVEAVGWRELPLFFERCGDLLAPDGAMLMQAITMDGRAYEVEKATSTFIKTVMFPGGCNPSIDVLARLAATRTDLRIVHLEDLSAHYVRTLQEWRRRLHEAAAELESSGYDERFRRRWRLYLAYCEAGFEERRIQDVQLLLAKPHFRAEPLWPLPTGTSGEELAELLSEEHA